MDKGFGGRELVEVAYFRTGKAVQEVLSIFRAGLDQQKPSSKKVQAGSSPSKQSILFTVWKKNGKS